MIDRMVRAAKLDVQLYEEVERDISATSEAAKVVLIVAVASAIGAIWQGIGAVILVFLSSIVGWVVWSAITYFIGKNLFATRNTRVSLGEMLRTLGFARSPGVLNVLGVIPILGALITFLVSIWVLVAGVIAVRQAMDFSTGRAILTTIVGWIVNAFLTLIWLAIF